MAEEKTGFDKLYDFLDFIVVPAFALHLLVLTVVAVGVQYSTCLKELYNLADGTDLTWGQDSKWHIITALTTTLLAFLVECVKRKRVAMANQKTGETKRAPPMVGFFLVPQFNWTVAHMFASTLLTGSSLIISLYVLGPNAYLKEARTDGVCQTGNSIQLDQVADFGTVVVSIIFIILVVQLALFYSGSFKSQWRVLSLDFTTKLDMSIHPLRDGNIGRGLVALAIAGMSFDVVKDQLDHATHCTAATTLFSNTLAIMFFSLASLFWAWAGADATEKNGDGSYTVAPLSATRVLAAVVVVLTLLNHLANKDATQTTLGCPSDEFTVDSHEAIMIAALVGMVFEVLSQSFASGAGYEGGKIPFSSTNHPSGVTPFGGANLRPSDMATERLTHDKPRRTGMQFV